MMKEEDRDPHFLRGRRDKYLGFYIDVLFFTTTILKRRGWSQKRPSVLLCVSTETTTSLCTHEYPDKTTALIRRDLD